MEDMIDVYGTNKDGIQVHLGKIKTPPNVKMQEIAQSYFGHDEMDTDCCIGALEDFFSWLSKSGYIKQ